jgi:hypothetical protein
MNLRWILIIFVIGFTLSVAVGGKFQNKTDRIIAICASISVLAFLLCMIWILRSHF